MDVGGSGGVIHSFGEIYVMVGITAGVLMVSM
jgi:hypothetical protein